MTKPKNFDLNCVEDDELDQEAMAFLNAQNDYFGVGGEHVADNIELNLNFRWDMTRARELCIAHKCPDDFSLMVSRQFRLSVMLSLRADWCFFDGGDHLAAHKATQVGIHFRRHSVGRRWT